MAESWIQVALDSTGKRVRNILLTAFGGGPDVYQQVVGRAKSDGTLLDDEATETTLALVQAKTANLDVAISTLLKAADTLTKVATVDTITNPVAVTGTFFQATQPISGTVSLGDDALESLRTIRRQSANRILAPRRGRLVKRKWNA